MKKITNEQRIQEIFMTVDEVAAKSLLMKAQTIVEVRFPNPAKPRRMPKIEAVSA